MKFKSSSTKQVINYQYLENNINSNSRNIISKNIFFRIIFFHNQRNVDLNLPEEFISPAVLTMAKICCYISKPQNLN